MNTSDRSTQRKANQYFFGKILFNLFLLILGTILIAVSLRWVQTKNAYARQLDNSRLAISGAASALKQNKENAEALAQIYHQNNQDVVDDLGQLLDRGLFSSLEKIPPEGQAEVFSDLAARSGASYLFLFSTSGDIVFASDPAMIGANPAAFPLMTQENINRLMKGTCAEDGSITPVLVQNQYGSFYFYSKPYSFVYNLYTIVIGEEASVLDSQTASLTDISNVLSRSVVSNGGFLFAADKEDNTFSYFVNGNEILSGQSTAECGLSKEALQDGYSGFETIKNKRYYCVSKAVGANQIVCAITEPDNITANDGTVIFWSILGFVIVMLLCLTYAVIVRNDFVSKAVETKKYTLNPGSKNPTYFDRTLFRRLVPLMMLGFIAIWCISFYTQTLLEITQSIDRTEIALTEVTGRYEENTTNSRIIQDYYSEMFLSKARLIAFLIEEDPSALNAATDRGYSDYDEMGERYYLTDDEGNPLRSVASSPLLQELCDSNSIEAIYIFDQEGHTIATNTPDWFYTVPHDAEDPSSGFVSVLEEKEDSMILNTTVSSGEEPHQYIGVAFHYFTKVNENGETEYTSRYAYEIVRRQQDPDGKGSYRTYGGITPHRSMVLITPDSELPKKVLQAIDADVLLSNNMLAGGIILLFDTSDDHLCIYSPNEPNIGKTAADLGISPNAFKEGGYYGFCDIGANSYFQASRYSQGYYISLLVPRDTMYQSRMLISLTTALISLILILILSGTVTITNKEEEALYESMSSEEAAKGLNSAIFNLVLPSGRNVSTVNVAARWNNRRIPWRERNPEQKLSSIVAVICIVVLFYIGFLVAGTNQLTPEGSVIRYILRGNWDRGLNVFALSSSALVIVMTGIFFFLFRIPVRLLTSLLGARGETIGHLLASVLRYGGVLIALFYCLHLLGVDSTSLLASAGILTLVVGLGAQNLINNIISGIFIIFEGEFRIGDIVTINDYRGTVMDIGLRTTKIMGMDGNIKIYNNSEISGILNMTQQASLARCVISIEYGQDIDYVEAVLNRDLPALATENPDILEGPTYMGVSALGESGVDLLIICKCNEKDIWGVTRYLNKKILQIFYDNDINVPFPNVTVSPLEGENRKTIRDFKDSEEDKEDKE